MSEAMVYFRNLGNREFDTEGTSILPQMSSLAVHPLEGVEIIEDEPLKDLSKFSPKLRILKVGDLSLLVDINLQIDGGYVAKTSALEFDAVGQGETEEEALQDIVYAIELLKEATTRNTSE